MGNMEKDARIGRTSSLNGCLFAKKVVQGYHNRNVSVVEHKQIRDQKCNNVKNGGQFLRKAIKLPKKNQNESLATKGAKCFTRSLLIQPKQKH